MAAYLYIVETNGTDAQGQQIHEVEQVIHNAMSAHPNIQFYKWVQSTGSGSLFRQWVMLFMVLFTSSGVNKADLDAAVSDIMQRIKTALPDNTVLAINIQVELLGML